MLAILPGWTEQTQNRTSFAEWQVLSTQI